MWGRLADSLGSAALTMSVCLFLEAQVGESPPRFLGVG